VPLRDKGIPGYGYGTGPVYLTGQVVGVPGAPGWFREQAALIVVDRSYSGPVLVRGHKADGTGGFPLSSPTGEVTFNDNPSSTDYRAWSGQIDAPPGCYGLQVDTLSGSAFIWILVVAGTPPPG
jgi:hypothetical protein